VCDDDDDDMSVSLGLCRTKVSSSSELSFGKGSRISLRMSLVYDLTREKAQD
jgi:hypothetical protein